MKKRILDIILSLAMALILLPAAVLAETDAAEIDEAGQGSLTEDTKDTLTITGVKMNAESYIYGGAAVGYDKTMLSVTGITDVEFDSSTLEYVYSGTLADGTSYAESTAAPTAAGSYTLTVRVPANNPDYTGKQEISFTIAARKITRPAQAAAVFYNGAEQTYGVASTAEYTVTGGVQKNANESGYDVTIALTDKLNTQWDDGTTADLTHKFIINKKIMTVTADEKEVYVDSKLPELTYTVFGLLDGDKLTTAPKLTTDADIDKAGIYTIRINGASAGINYTVYHVYGRLTVKNYPFDPDVPSYTPTYSPVIDDTDNGSVTVSPMDSEKGDTVTITPAPNKGYKVDEVIVTDIDGDNVAVADNGNGTYSFKQPGRNVTIKVTFAEIEEEPQEEEPQEEHICPISQFTDTDASAWYHDGVHFCLENGMMNGTGASDFSPDKTTSRAMIVTILWRLEGEPAVNDGVNFSDVENGKWYTDAVKWAAANNIVNGYGDGMFGPDDSITREQLAAILYRYEQYKGGGFTGLWMIRMDYADIADVSDWAYEAMCWMNMNGIVNGKPGNVLDPRGSATRAEAATMLYRYCEVMTGADN